MIIAVGSCFHIHTRIKWILDPSPWCREKELEKRIRKKQLWYFYNMYTIHSSVQRGPLHTALRYYSAQACTLHGRLGSNIHRSHLFLHFIIENVPCASLWQCECMRACQDRNSRGENKKDTKENTQKPWIESNIYVYNLWLMSKKLYVACTLRYAVAFFLLSRRACGVFVNRSCHNSTPQIQISQAKRK